jgi:hypothetical protein
MQMKCLWSVAVSLFMASQAYAQRVHVGLFGGPSAYTGDLASRIFPHKVTNGAIGLTFNYDLTGRLILRSGFTYSIGGGADRFTGDPSLVQRNLSFETQINELSVVGEYHLLNLNTNRFSPYVFAGLAVFKYDPYAYDRNGQKVYLKPLSTEGQGLSVYPDRKPYQLIQPAIPFGGGVKWVINDTWRISAEFGLRKLLTEYLDDVSTNYVDEDDLLQAKGLLAVDMAYRGDEVPGGNPRYPAMGDKRGNPKSKDYYYFAGLHLTYRVARGRKPDTGCPVNVY